MKKSDINPLPEYFDRYINLVDDVELEEAFIKSLDDLRCLNIDDLIKLKDKTYLPGKWTVNEVIQHIADIERLLCSGTLRFARNESEHVISFDENKIAKNSKANEKQIKNIIDELISVRQATIKLYESFDNNDLLKTGINWKHRISIIAMGFNIIGHQIHHLNFIEANYSPLLNKQ